MIERCPECGAANPPGRKTCSLCDRPMPQAPSRAPARVVEPPPAQVPVKMTGVTKTVPAEDDATALATDALGGIGRTLSRGGCIVLVGLVLAATGVGALLGAPLILYGVGMAVGGPIFAVIMARRRAKTGEGRQFAGICPYCGQSIVFFGLGFDCPACAQRIVARGGYLFTVARAVEMNSGGRPEGVSRGVTARGCKSGAMRRLCKHPARGVI